MNTLRSLKRLLVCGLVTALTSASASAISEDKLAELKTKAEAGNGISQYNLGLIYADPQEPIGSILEAYVWFSLAADNGAPGKALMIVTNQLTPEQLSNGKKLLEQRRADLAAHRPIVIASAPKTPDSSPVTSAATSSPVVAAPVVAASTEPDVTAIKAELKKASDNLAVATKENQQLKTQLDKAQAQQATLDQAQQERDKLAATVATYTNEISTMRAAAANFEGERNALQQKIADATKQSKDSMAAELAATTAKLKAAESELTKADATTAELITSKQTLASLNEQLQKTTGENQRLASLVKQAESSSAEKTASSEKTLNEINGELLKTQAKLAEATGNASTANAETTALRQTNTDLGVQLKKLIEEKEQSLAQGSKTTAAQQQQVEALTSKLKSSEESLAKATAGQAELSQQLAAVKSAPPKQDPEAQAQLAKLSTDLEAAQRTAASEKETLSAKLKTTEETLAKTSTEQAELAQQLATIKAAPPKQDPETEARIAKLFADLEAAQHTAASEKEALSAKLKIAEDASANNQAELAQLKNKLETARAENTKSLSSATEIENRNKENADLQAKLETSQKALAAASAEQAALEQKLKAIKPSKKEAAALAKVDQLKAELEAAQADAAKNQTSTAELESARKENSDLQAKLKTSEEALVAAKAAPALTTPTVAASTETPASDISPDIQKELYEAQIKLDASLRSYQLQQNEIERLQNALANIDNERAKLAERLQAANTEVSSASSKAAANNDAAAQLAGVREQLRQTQNQLASIAYENTEMKHRIAFMAPTQGNITPLPVSTPAVSFNTPNRPSANKPASVEPTTTPATAAPRVHTVASGETLSTIAKRYYGSANRWTEILEANKATLRDPTALRVGMKIKIP